MLRGSLLLFALTGCARLFGLETPVAQDASADVPGADSDAPVNVEGCVTLPLRNLDDDDGDRIADDVDNCIGLQGAQSDSDMDGIGDGCDATATVDQRYCVWTFREPESGEDPDIWTRSWSRSGAGWSMGPSNLTHVGATTPEFAEVRDAYFTAPGGIAIDVRDRIDGYSLPFVVGIELAGAGPGQSTFTCRWVQNVSGSLELLRDGEVEDAYAVPVALPQQFTALTRLSAVVTAGKLTVRCNVLGSSLPAVQVAMDYPLEPILVRPRLFAANGNVFFDHVTLYKLSP